MSPLALAVALSLLATDAGGPPTDRAPRLFVPVTHHDAGDVVRGQEVRHDFLIRNDDEWPIVITPSYRAAIRTPDPSRVLAPGESLRIPVRLSTRHYRGPSSKTVFVRVRFADQR
ncbi:MAG: DUF1573 domain-containing protein [Acidobacteriota bacterium]